MGVAASLVSSAFAEAGMHGFLSDLAQDAARRGSLYLAWLSCDDAVVACHMGFVAGGVLHLYHTTYDAAYGAFSPGNALMVETIQWAADQKMTAVDFMRGDEAYKTRFASQTRCLMTYVAGRSWLGKAVVTLWQKVSD